MRQVNRVQLSFFSVLKIFAIFGVGVALATFTLWCASYFLTGADVKASVMELAVFLFLSPLTFLLFAVLGYPFYSLVNKYRGGLQLTVVKRPAKIGN